MGVKKEGVGGKKRGARGKKGAGEKKRVMGGTKRGGGGRKKRWRGRKNGGGVGGKTRGVGGKRGGREEKKGGGGGLVRGNKEYLELFQILLLLCKLLLSSLDGLDTVGLGLDSHQTAQGVPSVPQQSVKSRVFRIQISSSRLC